MLLAAAAFAMTGCDGDAESSYKQLDSEAQAEVENIATGAEALTGELENKTIKWMSNWDINPGPTGKNTPIGLALFQERYGGVVEYHAVDWNTRFDTLANAINGGEGIDFFPAGAMDVFPRGAIKDMFVPYDDYINSDAALWSEMKETMDLFVWNDKHYIIPITVTGDNCVVIYNRDTIVENGLKDPAELFAKGEWTWDTFEEMLEQFVNPAEGQYGIDGWWFEAGLSATCGVPYIGIEDGKLVNNMKDPAVERLQEWMYGLGTKGHVAIGVGDYGWNEMPEYIGSGKTLFLPAGAWKLYVEKAQWEPLFGENVMFVPMPRDPNADEYYIPAGMNAYVMVKGGQNPEGVAKYCDCERVAALDEDAKKLSTEQLYEDFGWTEEMVAMLESCNAIANENPYFDFYTGVSEDVSTLLDSNEYGVRATSKGMVQWSECVSTIYSAVNAYLDEMNNTNS